jgi:hypothetical protein
MVPLTFPCGHVINDGVSPNMLHCIGLLNLESTLPNDHPDFSLIIHCICEPRMWEYWVTMGNNACSSFREDDRVCWLVGFVAGIISRGIKSRSSQYKATLPSVTKNSLNRMLIIVFANRKNISAADRWEEFNFFR